MAEIKGTNVASPIVPFTDKDIYATHEAQYGKGGYRSVKTIEDLDRIPEARLEEGMLVYVIDDPSGINTYQYIKGKWIKSKVSLGIPILNQDLIDEYGLNPDKDSYISIPNLSDLEGEVTNNTYTTTANGNYVDILFKALRELQSEVSKLRNSFLYGIESYTGTTTAMSSITEDLSGKLPEEEPLWAIMEGNLSKISDIALGDGHPFNPRDNVQIVNDPNTSFTFLRFNSTGGTWKPEADVLKATDSKLFLYLTTKGRSLKVNIDVYGSNMLPIDSDKYAKTIDFSKISPDKITKSGIYNILLVISRSQKQSDGKFYGKNFIWISISDPFDNKTLSEGYWSDDNILYESAKLLNEFQRYNFSSIFIRDIDLTKFNLYSKWQDFSKEVIPSKPSDQDYKFKAAHISIRAVSDQAVLMSVKDQILNNELIFVEDTKKLWIKSKNILTPIAGGGSSEGGGGEETGGMTKEELIAELKKMGIVQDENNNLKISNLNIEDIVFIHQATGKRFKYFVDSEGKLCSRLLSEESTEFSNKLKGRELFENSRGFIGNLNSHIVGKTIATDFKLLSDRLKIGSFYAPYNTDIIHGCSHSFIELENTSDVDINLKGCYLHCTRPDSNYDYEQKVYHLELTGVIPAGGTYLIRGKKFAEYNDPNVFIKVKTFDQEWFANNGAGNYEPISFEIYYDHPLTAKTNGYGFALTYGNSFGDAPSELTSTTQLVKKSNIGDQVKEYNGNTFTIEDKTAKGDYPYLINPFFIDGIYYHKQVEDASGNGYWALNTVMFPKSNTLCKNTFELDPAKQAFQAFTKKDCSRPRWTKDSDYQIVDLSKEFIEFPHTDGSFDLSSYTPKASFEHKNVCTDKTKLDDNKPNMVNCSFGTNIYTTRCFNWISVGYFPEYVWIKKGTDTESPWLKKIQSYLPVYDFTFTEVAPKDSNTSAILKFKDIKVKPDLSKYKVILDEHHKSTPFSISSISVLEDGKYQIILVGNLVETLNTETTYSLTSIEDDNPSNLDSYPKRKVFNSKINNNIYSRISGRFPANNSFYTAHKVVVDITETSVPESSPVVYSYIVGREDKNGNPDPNHSSEVFTFTLYPESYTPRIYQVTDQQGFDWIQYQVWAAAAKKVDEKITEDSKQSHIIPIIINTGDMTQNGTRVNEWYDYYEAGKILFSKYEQMYVVGNNDLCGTNPNILGTGDDDGKSNSFYFHLFYCYEVGGNTNGNIFEPLIPQISKTVISDKDLRAPKYIPSFYYFDSKEYRFIMVNSEITEMNCLKWFECTNGSSVGGDEIPINIYTGYSINGENNEYIEGFTTIYTMLWRILKDAQTKNKKVVVACHEMPFTVITRSSLKTAEKTRSRSLSNANKLIGSHLNQISSKEVGSNSTPKGIYWFSRLLEYFKVKLVIGGHKHTYTCTYPCRENYTYKVNGETRNSEAGPMEMKETLKDDSVEFLVKETLEGSSKISQDNSKFPFVKRAELSPASEGSFYPCVCKPNLTGGVVYFMCQATGYKLTSNKELPSPDQKFTRVLPNTKKDDAGKDQASNEQRYPMFSIVSMENSKFSIKLARVLHILSSHKFGQNLYESGDMSLEWLTEKPDQSDNFGDWVDYEAKLFDVD